MRGSVFEVATGYLGEKLEYFGATSLFLASVSLEERR